MTTTNNTDKNILLQNILSNLPEDIVNIIDDLSQEYKEIPISYIISIDSTEYKDKDGNDIEEDDIEDTVDDICYNISKCKKKYKVIIQNEDDDDEVSQEYSEKKELVSYSILSVLDCIDRHIMIGEEFYKTYNLKDFIDVFYQTVDLIGKIYEPAIPIEVNNKLKCYIYGIGSNYHIQKNKNMYSIHSRDYDTLLPMLTYKPSQVCIFKEKYLIKYINYLKLL